MISTKQSVVAIYDNLSQAQRAVAALHRGGVVAEQISLMTKHGEEDPLVEAAVEHGDRAETDAARGAILGGALGLLAGVAFFTLPGIGPLVVLGPLAAGMTGAIVGSLVGAMTGWGIPEDQAAKYEEHLRAGQVLVVVHGDPLLVTEAHAILEATDPADLNLHAESSEDSPEIDDSPLRKPR